MMVISQPKFHHGSLAQHNHRHKTKSHPKEIHQNVNVSHVQHHQYTPLVITILVYHISWCIRDISFPKFFLVKVWICVTNMSIFYTTVPERVCDSICKEGRLWPRTSASGCGKRHYYHTCCFALLDSSFLFVK